MLKILLAVDGSESAVRATRKLIEMLRSYAEVPQIDLATVHHPVPYLGGLSRIVVTREMVESYYKEEGERALAPSAQALHDAGVRFSTHILVGDVAQTIARHAHESGCAMIYMGTRGMTVIPNLALGSIATKVLHLVDVPVLLVK